MLAGALQQLLKANGLTPVFVAAFGDYRLDTSWAVRAEPRSEVSLDDGSYAAGVQLRSRAADIVAAENAGRTALAIVLAADGSTINWTDPTSVANRSFKLEAISIVNRPTWFPTIEPGEETSCNLQLVVTEV